MPVSGLIRKVGLAEQIFSRWKQRGEGLESARVRQLKPRYEENARLTRLVGDFTLDQVMVPDVLSKQFSSPRARAPWWSSCGGHDQASELRAGRTARCAKSTSRYRSGQDPRTALRQRIRARARVQGRYGSRQIQGWLNRESWVVGTKLVARLS